MSTGSPLRVGIFVFDDAEELDVVGPYEVLAAWAALSDLRPEVLTFSTDGSGVRLAKGLRIVPDRSADDVLPHAALAACAASSALSTSAAFDRAIWQITWPVIGVTLSKYSPDAGGVHLPPM